MDFCDALTVRESNPNYGFRLFNSIRVGPYLFSIQASETHYCSPRETLEDPHDYTEWEMAVMDNEGNFLQLSDTPMGDCGIEQSYDGVCGFVPAEKVQELYERCMDVVTAPNGAK